MVDMVIIVVVAGTMVVLCSCSIAWSPIDKGVKAWKRAACLGKWTGLRCKLRSCSGDGSEVVEVVLVVGTMMLLLLLLWWLKAGAGGLIVDGRLDVVTRELGAGPRMFAHGGGMLSS